MWTNRNCCVRKAAVTMAMLPGRACAPSAGGRSTRKPGRDRSRRTGLWLRSKLDLLLMKLSCRWNETVVVLLRKFTH